MKNKKGQFVKGHHWRKPKPWWDKGWLEKQYIEFERSAADIANDNGVTENTILYWLKKHRIKTRTMREIRANKYWGASGADNPMWKTWGWKMPE